MKRPDPILVADRFPQLRLRLMDLLSRLSDQQWALATIAPLWSVKDVALHLLGGDLGILSRRRDRFTPNQAPIRQDCELVALVNRLNSEWITAARRLSPRVLCDLLDFTGPQVEAYLSSLDPMDLGQPVSWVGPEPAPLWMDIAREFTERWHHQQQIRDATSQPPLYDPYFLGPVLDAFVRALPHTFRDTPAKDGVILKLEITGDAGGSWFLRRGEDNWDLILEANGPPTAEVVISQDLAWRLFTKGIDAKAARSLATAKGADSLVSKLFKTVAVIA